MSKLKFYLDGPKDAPTLVLGHSLGSDRHVWDEVTSKLSDSWKVVRWELPGHGASEIPLGPATMDNLVDELLSGLDELGIEKFHVAGISLGGMVALAVAEAVPERVLSLAMLDSGPSLPPGEQWLARAAQVRAEGMEALVDGTMERWFSRQLREGPHAARVNRTRESFLQCDPEGYAYCCEVIAGTDLEAGLQDVGMPTLVLTGSEDAGMTPQQAADLAAQIPGAAGVSEVIPGAKHMTCVEHPVRVAAALHENMCAAM